MEIRIGVVKIRRMRNIEDRQMLITFIKHS